MYVLKLDMCICVYVLCTLGAVRQPLDFPDFYKIAVTYCMIQNCNNPIIIYLSWLCSPLNDNTLQEHHFEMSQAGMRTRLRQLRALLSLTDNEFYEYLSESSEMHNVIIILVHYKSA